MKTISLLLSFLISTCAFAQPAKSVKNQSKMQVNGNSNIIQILQADKIVTYNLLNNNDAQSFVRYIQSIPSIIKLLKQLNKDHNQIKQELKNQVNLILKIVKNTSKQGFSVNDFTIELEKYITENIELKAELKQIKDKNRDNEFAQVLKVAEEKLRQFDHEGYQNILEDFRNKRRAKRQKEDIEFAQASYLQAKDSFNEYQYNKALDQIEEALIYNKDMLEYSILKGEILRGLSQFEDAITAYKYIETETLDDTLKSIIFNNLGTLYSHTERIDSAIIYLNKALNILLSLKGQKNLIIATIYNNLGLAYNETKNYSLSLKYFFGALSLRKKLSGVAHEEVGKIYNNLADVFKNQGEYDKAIMYHDSALVIYNKELGKEHPRVALVLNNLGAVYQYKGEYDKSIYYYNRSLKIAIKALEPKNPQLGQLYDNLGLIYTAKDNYNEAIKYFKLALNIFRNTLSIEHPYVQSCLLNISYAYFANQNSSEGFTSLEQVKAYIDLPINKKIIFFNNKSFELFEEEKIETSLYFQKASLEILVKYQLPKTDDLWVIVNKHLAIIYCKIGNKTESAKYFEQALVYAKEISKDLIPSINEFYEECKK